MKRRGVSWAVGALGISTLAAMVWASPAEPPAEPAEAPQAAAPAGATAEELHAAVLAEDPYPSAAQCATCHAGQYEEWRASSHAYASISPMFHKFEQAINDLSQGTVGYFCMRCHAGVGTALGESRDLPLWQRSRVSREGVTCISCHRVDESYGKVNGERRIVPGDIHQPVYGSLGGDGVREVVANREAYNVAVAPDQSGLKMHRQGIRFAQLATSELCVSCHQVAVHPGIKLEAVWDAVPLLAGAGQRGSAARTATWAPAPGATAAMPAGRRRWSTAAPSTATASAPTTASSGPGTRSPTPASSPTTPTASASPTQTWLRFDWRAGWGTDEFEAGVADGPHPGRVPARVGRSRRPCRGPADRRRQPREGGREARPARPADGEQLAHRRPVLRPPAAAGQGPAASTTGSPTLNNGHNLPSGSLGAQPEIWLNVALIGPDGRNVWESGYVDSHGDMADLHSLDVAAGTVAHDDQLFNLQTKFLTTNVKGTDREMYLPVTFDPDQIPFIRPAGTPNSVLNHPPFIRMEKRSLPPLGSREARYRVPADRLARPGTYRLAVRLRSRAEPIYFMQFVGATEDMKRAMNEWMLDVHPYTVQFEVR